MAGYPLPIRVLIEELSRFPGIGEKTAARLAAYVLQASTDDMERLADSILEVKKKIRICSICFNLAERELCDVCNDESRDRGVICVVEDTDTLVVIEDSGGFSGTYHVLHGVLSPAEGIGPEQLRLDDLVRRVTTDGVVREVFVATNPSVQGETTALLIKRLLEDTPVMVTRIALGVPLGGSLKYVDRMTMAKAIEFRRGV
ncbi:MAG: recombination mediator RecR [Syntrophales bacterium]|jgi:recombination protein RecR|nr:recombination mediator RecR [Syntrophales bacterium]MCK9528302.1 recombination mediator RecR [Syntrophales bacterium]MDX9922141.1 recombination mediator RecR [Syntrophales bacterium]